MADPEDNWPSFNVGERKHLHALGVISVCYSAFEHGMHELYLFHPLKQKIPEKIAHLYYLSLNEEKRLKAITETFNAFEKDPRVKASVRNIIKYFNWAREVRNTLLHAEHYPPLFGGDPELLYLTKRQGKQIPKTAYVTISLPNLRKVANQIQDGVQQCATIRIFLRVRGQSAESLPISLRMFAHESLPEILPLPTPVRLSLKPHNAQQQRTLLRPSG